jgi:hypothetical protein
MTSSGSVDSVSLRLAIWTFFLSAASVLVPAVMVKARLRSSSEEGRPRLRLRSSQSRSCCFM